MNNYKNKCDFCRYSVRRFGRLVCPFDNCMLREQDIEKILNVFFVRKES